jgi:sugar (pentulose or hexulose) kinase
MASRDLVLGLDSSTTACKAIIVHMQGNVVSAGRADLPIEKPRASWHEQPAESWWESACRALREAASGIDRERLAGMAIAAQRETFVPTDESGHPLANALLWMDERCRDLLPEIGCKYGRESIHRESGKPLSANLSLGKLYWLHQKHPHLLRRDVRILDVHSFLARRLTGRFVTSWGCADPTGLFNTERKAWNAPLIRAIGLREDQFPEALAPAGLIGEISTQAAALSGLPPGLPLVVGIGDGQAAGLGACVVSPAESYLNLGTAIVSGTFSDRYLVNSAFRTMTGGIPGTYVLETVLLGGTYTVSWFIENFSGLARSALADGRSPEDVLEAAAAEIPPGADGLVLVPYWNSAMNPYWDAAASGIVVGWRGIHQAAHFYRAILEGIAFEQRLHTLGVESALGQEIERFVAVGGGAKSPLWCQIIADVTGKSVFRAATSEAAALGAAILAAAGVGLHPDVQTAARAMTGLDSRCFIPVPERRAFYERLYQDVYRSLFPSLQKYLGALDNLSLSTRDSLTRS